ncbi:(2Fe-2S)-binding protein [Desulforhopalus sp. IMCC35007]|uniref:(2Fe-2S)-binding protein n=1 Tax=Desulforhopalus sp. IMCC35007 TaxID=2569543 RepID=UPI0010AE5A60|nr:2Fe-2S iron-sulfur cluster-binding protein [Desulforhopalus sp. IMCC35007]TKB08607.1 2Fe-2S iron-sulfur cluster binding domain-containing protein [Desulforhopalus sp. IMCC35007]
MQLETTINGNTVTLDFAAGEFLSETLRRYGYLSVKEGCDTGSCGLCTVWLDGKPTLSCSTLTARMQGHEITTIEALAGEAEEFARFLVAEGAEQCGFCAPGFAMTVLAMKRELKEPTVTSINHYLAGNLCRCSGYKGQMRAIVKYLGVK